MPKYKTNHHVGRFAPDTLVTDQDLEGADVSWLLSSGAIDLVDPGELSNLDDVTPEIGSGPAESVEFLKADLETARSRVLELEQKVTDLAQSLQDAEERADTAGKAAAELAEQNVALSAQMADSDQRIEDLRALVDLIIPKTASALKGLNEEQLRAIAGYRQIEDIPGTKDGIIAVLAPKE